jgi:3-dehydroquinate dehydratase/shikimate dehydrogenase
MAGADLVELRLDSVENPDVTGALAGRRTPVIVTCRPKWEGGGFSGSEEERRRILAAAIDAGAEFVDVEWRAGFGDLVSARRGRGIVLSFHDFDRIPADLPALARQMRATGAEVIKIAGMAHRLTDALPLLELGQSGDSQAQVLVAMGPAGIASRVLAGRFGSRWTYSGDSVAPGQIGPAEMLGRYHYRSIDETTAVYALTGAPLGHSLSPAMHNAGFRATGANAVYLPLETTDPDDFMTFAKALGVRGASITAPLKVALCSRADEIDPLSRRAGAINTLRLSDARWIGTNTDVPGFLAPLERVMSLPGIRASVLGAGGAARGVAIALASRSARVTICARDRQRAGEVAGVVDAGVGEFPPRPGTWDLLVNATPLGTFPSVDVSPVPADALRSGVVYDLVYNPTRTKLLQDAAAAGLRTIGGLDMLIAQAQLQFELWTGRRAADEIFRQAALEALAARSPAEPAAPVSSPSTPLGASGGRS